MEKGLQTREAFLLDLLNTEGSVKETVPHLLLEYIHQWIPQLTPHLLSAHYPPGITNASEVCIIDFQSHLAD